MKVKTLRFKDTKEFVHILEGGQLATSSIPDILADSASIEALEKYYENFLGKKINTENLEVVEYDFFESGEIGADLRNKLTSPLSLVALLTTYFGDDDIDRDALLMFIKKEMQKTKDVVEYISKLF